MLKKFLNKLSTEVKAIAAVALAAVLLISIILGAGAISACTKKKPHNQPFVPSETVVDVKGATATEITGGYQTGTARAPQTSEYLGTVDKIVKPVAGVMDEHETYGVKVYPNYGKNLTGYTVEERNGLIKESHALAPSPTWKSLGIYNAIDAEGYLLKNGQRVKYADDVEDSDDEDEEGEIISGGLEEEGEAIEEAGSASVNKQYNQTYRKLYAHTASLTHFGGGLSDDEPRIIKKITAVTHMKLESTQLTGLYAPAGEVIKFEMSLIDYQAAGGLRVLIGQNYNLYQHVSMETSGNGIKGSGLSRMPDILSIFQYNDANGGVVKDAENGTVTFYVGSFFGGPIYFRPIKNDAERKISVTVSGAVRYQHFILGATAKEEYEYNKESTAPYFDLEVYDSVRFTTHKYASSNGLALKDFTYENCTDAAVLWDKIAEVSTRVRWNGLSGASAPVYIIGDCYIAAGAAFANPGRNGVVCPPDWLAEALNYNKFVSSGSWGTMHEYNHCWQGYGLKNGGEVTNNATTLIAYSLYTKISAGRTSSVGWGNGNWIRFTDPSKALGELLNLGKDGSIREDLSVYATLLHNIGQDQFIKAAQGGKDSGANVYFNNLVSASHTDMTYYFTDVLHLGVDSARGISQATADAATAKHYPMFVPVSSVYQVGRSIVYDGKKQDIITAQPFSYGNGAFTMDFNNKNNFAGSSWTSKALVIPDGFTVNVKSVTQPQNGKVELLENNQVKYTPASGNSGVYSGNFRVTLEITKNDNAFEVEDVDLIINLKQSANTAMDRTTYVYEDNAPDPANVLSADKKTFNFGEYKETETIKNVCGQDSNSEIWATGRNYYDAVYDKNSKNYKTLPVDKTLQTMEGVLYFSNPSAVRFTLRGRGKTALYLSYDKGQTWENPLIIERTSGTGYVDTEYVEHEFATGKNVVYYKVVHLVKAENNFFGIGVASKQSNGTFSAFSHANVISASQIDLYEAVNAENAKKFETDYHFENSYTYSYTNDDKIWASGNRLVSVNYDSWDDTLSIGNMFDGNTNTYYHSKGGADNYITEAKPLQLVVDLGSECTVNRVTFNGYKGTVGTNNGMVKDFRIYGSLDGQNFDTLVTEVTNSPANAKNMAFNFDSVKIRYYKLIVTRTDNGKYFAMNSIVFSNYLSFADPKGIMVAPNADCVRYTGTWGYKNVLSNYGLVYTAGKDAYVEFTFTGSRFAYFADRAENYGKVDIYIDGKLVAGAVDLSANNYPNVSHAVYDYFNIAGVADALAYIYDGDALSGGEHTVKIVGKGSFNVGSFAYWA